MALCYSVFSIACAKLWHSLGAPLWSLVLVLLCFAGWMSEVGLRPDALAMAWLALGCLCLCRPRWWFACVGLLFLGAAMLTYIGIAGYALALGGACLFLATRQPAAMRWGGYLTALAVASTLNCVMFLLCIDFDIGAFVRALGLHASWRRVSLGRAPCHFVETVLGGWGAVLVAPSLALAAIALLLLRKTCPAPVRSLTLGIAVGLVLNLFIYSSATGYALFFAQMAVVLVVATARMGRVHRAVLIGVCCGALFASQYLNILSLTLREHGVALAATPEASSVAEAREAAVDEVAARFVFDYHLPPRTTAWHFLLSPPQAYPTSIADKREGAVWIVSEANLGLYVADVQNDYPRITFLGHRYGSRPREPYKVLVLP